MKRKILILLCLILVKSIFAENNYLFVSFYKPYGKAPTYTEEYTFYDDGLIKEITYYDLREEAALLNRCIADSSILRDVFYIIPTIPKATTE